MNPLLPALLAIAALAIGVAIGWWVGGGRAGELADLQADARNFETRIKELMEAKEQLSAQFHEVGAKLLSEAQKQFLERADARFNQAGEKSEAQLKALLQPVEATLKRYEEGLTKVEKERIDSYAGLREAVTLLHAG